MPGLGMIGGAEAQQVEAGDRPRAHGEHVAQDAADPGRRALIGLDERGVVVALHLEDAGLAVADVDDAGVLAGPLDDPRRLRRQAAQMPARGFVGAVLVPHRRDDAEFGETRRAADQRDESAYSSGFRPCATARASSTTGSADGHGASRSIAAPPLAPQPPRGQARQYGHTAGTKCADVRVLKAQLRWRWGKFERVNPAELWSP